MKTTMDRRTFLKRTALASVVFGLPVLSRLTWADETDGLLTVALGRMENEKRPGVLIFVPIHSPEAGLPFLDMLTEVLWPKNGVSHQVFCEALFVCLPKKPANTKIAGLQ